jgi:hypothetical protein
LATSGRTPGAKQKKSRATNAVATLQHIYDLPVWSAFVHGDRFMSPLIPANQSDPVPVWRPSARRSYFPLIFTVA